ncbi:MAG TPA: hypothetical protein DER09_00260 [Prolixibacteraceae bacterium]|nr:hypothetical protein [Prolixibacteraceae bacterium]
MNQINQLPGIIDNRRQIKNIFIAGGVGAIIALLFIFLDVAIGNITGGNLSGLPQTAVERFNEFQQNTLLGLYHLDLLNMVVQIILILPWFALYMAHRDANHGLGMLSLIFFLLGSTIMVSGNTALPMLELSHKYFATADVSQKMLYAAAGESLLAMGAHGSPGIFIGFFIPNIANLILSVVMVKGGIFSRLNGWLGIVGSIFMLLYVALVNFVPGVEKMATAFAMPGGLLLMAWMIMFTVRLFKMAK